MKISRVLETCLYVDDLAAAESFYTQVLGLDSYGRQTDRHVFLRCGDQMLLLFEPAASARPDSEVPLHGAHGPGHAAFAVAPRDLAAWRDRLEQAGVAIEQVVQWPQGGQSLYFRDPAGNSLELATPSIWGIAEE